MQNTSIGKMDKFIVHFVGNKNRGEGVRFSTSETPFENVDEHIFKLINISFNFEEL